jgi:hypothetical protein
MADNRTAPVFVPAVVICAWLIPGGGYFLIGQRVRAIAVFVAIVALFLMGIVVGGIRIMDPPGWGQYGYMTQLVQRYNRGQHEMEDDYTRIEPASPAEEANPSPDDLDQSAGAALKKQPLAELADKPWYVGQILCGPITLLASAVSVNAAHPSPDNPGVERWPSSHSRSWEIGALYTAVAGMLNLLVIIDSAHRASQFQN